MRSRLNKDISDYRSIGVVVSFKTERRYMCVSLIRTEVSNWELFLAAMQMYVQQGSYQVP